MVYSYGLSREDFVNLLALSPGIFNPWFSNPGLPRGKATYRPAEAKDMFPISATTAHGIGTIVQSPDKSADEPCLSLW